MTRVDMLTIMVTAEERLWTKVRKTDTCWLWQGAKSDTGYGNFQVDGRQVLVHRYAYELLVGPIPKGLVIDHLCRTPLCVNPSHLEPVTRGENNRRGFGWAGTNHRKTHCPQGHLYTVETTYIRPDGKGTCCHVCLTVRNRARKVKRP